jgi:hypothetical protein
VNDEKYDRQDQRPNAFYGRRNDDRFDCSRGIYRELRGCVCADDLCGFSQRGKDGMGMGLAIEVVFSSEFGRARFARESFGCYFKLDSGG